MVNKCCVPGCQSNYKKRDVEYKYVPIFSFPKNEDLQNVLKSKIPRDNLVATQNPKVCMKHCGEKVLWKYNVFPCSNADPDIIVSKTIHLMNYNY